MLNEFGNFCEYHLMMSTNWCWLKQTNAVPYVYILSYRRFDGIFIKYPWAKSIPPEQRCLNDWQVSALCICPTSIYSYVLCIIFFDDCSSSCEVMNFIKRVMLHFLINHCILFPKSNTYMVFLFSHMNHVDGSLKYYDASLCLKFWHTLIH